MDTLLQFFGCICLLLGTCYLWWEDMPRAASAYSLAACLFIVAK